VGGRTLVMVTHRPAVLELVDRIVVVDGGRVVLDGPKAQVLATLSGQKPPATAAPPPPPQAAEAAAPATRYPPPPVLHDEAA
jgi:ATP-binding cassette, subfamily C, bacterial LapB